MNKQDMINEGLREYEDQLVNDLFLRATAFARKNTYNWDWQTLASEQFHLSFKLLTDNAKDSIAKTIMTACRKQAEQRRMKRRAESIGLVYWPALFCRDVDPAAFVAAEAVLIPQFGEWNGKDCHGGWDQMGHHGLSPWFIKTAWFNAGCKDSPKFRKMLTVKDHAKKGESLEKFHQYLIGKRWVDANQISMNLSRKAVIALGRISPVARWAALQDVEYDPYSPRRIRELNWQRVKEVSEMKLWKKCAQPELPSRLRWRVSGKDVPVALQQAWVASPRPSWVKGAAGQIGPFDLAPKIMEELMHLPEEEFGPLVMLHKFWGKELPRALTEIYPGMSTHDAGQDLIRLSATELVGEINLGWRKLAWKTIGASLRYCGQYADIRTELGRIPDTLNELKRAATLCQYGNLTPETRPIAEICSTYNVGQYAFEEYCRLFKSPQADYNSIPGTRITGADIGLEGNWKLERLATDSLIGPFLGLATNCCQHLHGAGADCARKIWTDERSAAWVVHYNGEIVAQSYVWRDQDTLVIDSIEALGGAYVEGIAKLYQRAVEQIVGQFGIKDVLLASTSYGITKQVRKIMAPNAEKFKHDLNCPSHYSDAGKVVKIN